MKRRRNPTATIKPGFGYWDVTRYPRGGDFRRATSPIELIDVQVVEKYSDGTAKEIVGKTADGRRICVGTQCLSRINPVNGAKHKTTMKNPARLRRLPSGKTRVRGRRKRLLARGTTRARGARQIRKLRAMAHGWKPRRGVPARDVRAKVARLGNETMAFRKNRKWSVIRGSVKAGRFHVIAKGLSDLQLRKWYRGHGYKAKAL